MQKDDSLGFEWQHKPTLAEMAKVLARVPAWPGSTKTLADYLEYIILLCRSKRTDRGRTYTWRPYVGVDGRIRMFADAHIEHGATYTEEILETKQEGPFLVVRMRITSPLWGIREDIGTADLEARQRYLAGEQGQGMEVDVTNPYENALTSVRGRVIGAFGIGIIPTGGLASAEEILAAVARAKSLGEEVASVEAVAAADVQSGSEPQASSESQAEKQGEGPASTTGLGEESAADSTTEPPACQAPSAVQAVLTKACELYFGEALPPDAVERLKAAFVADTGKQPAAWDVAHVAALLPWAAQHKGEGATWQGEQVATEAKFEQEPTEAKSEQEPVVAAASEGAGEEVHKQTTPQRRARRALGRVASGVQRPTRLDVSEQPPRDTDDNVLGDDDLPLGDVE